jgi:hypothetical protein
MPTQSGARVEVGARPAVPSELSARRALNHTLHAQDNVDRNETYDELKMCSSPTLCRHGVR